MHESQTVDGGEGVEDTDAAEDKVEEKEDLALDDPFFATDEVV